MGLSESSRSILTHFEICTFTWWQQPYAHSICCMNCSLECASRFLVLGQQAVLIIKPINLLILIYSTCIWDTLSRLLVLPVDNNVTEDFRPGWLHVWAVGKGSFCACVKDILILLLKFRHCHAWEGHCQNVSVTQAARIRVYKYLMARCRRRCCSFPQRHPRMFLLSVHIVSRKQSTVNLLLLHLR